MEETLVKFETAVLAKLSGFNIPCNKMFTYGRGFKTNSMEIKFHNGDKGECSHIPHDWNNTKCNTNTLYFSRPTQTILAKWLREEYEIHINVNWIPGIDYEKEFEIGLQEALILIK